MNSFKYSVSLLHIFMPSCLFLQMNTPDNLLFALWGRRVFHGKGAKFFSFRVKQQSKCPSQQSQTPVSSMFLHKQMNALFFKSQIINYRMITSEMGLLLKTCEYEMEEPDVFHTGLFDIHICICIHTNTRTYMYILLLIQQYFIVKENPSVAAHSRAEVKTDQHCSAFLEYSGDMAHFFFPKSKKPLGNAYRRPFPPKYYNQSVPGVSLDISVDIWDCSSHRDVIGPQSNGSL